MIITLKTTNSRENVVIESLSKIIKNKNFPIKSIFHPSEIKGYIFIEGQLNDIEVLIKGVPHIRGLIKKDVPIEQLERFIIIEKQEIKIDVGDIVEIVGGPMKGDKAKVTRTNETKNEITVESLEGAIPIPVTIPISSVTIFEKRKEI